MFWSGLGVEGVQEGSCPTQENLNFIYIHFICVGGNVKIFPRNRYYYGVILYKEYLLEV
jgi:hypothetical protein